MTIPERMTRVIRGLFYLLFIIVPIILTPVNYELFEYNKMMVTYGICVFILGAWMIKWVSLKKISIRKTPLDIPIALFLLSQLVSALFSMDGHVSWFGYYSRFNGGMLSLLCYTALYYAFVSNWNDAPYSIARAAHELKKSTKTAPGSGETALPMLKIMLATGIAVSIYAVLQRMGIDKHLWVQDVQSRVFSTMGQPNWLAAYLIALLPLGMVVSIKQKTSEIINPSRESLQFFLWFVTSILFFVVVLFTRSRSGLAALFAADVLLWIALFLRAPNRKTKFYQALLFHGVFAVIIFFNGVNIPAINNNFTWSGIKTKLETARDTSVVANNPETVTPSGTAMEFGGTESGTIRKYVWEGAITAWLSSPKTVLIGTGVETFAFAYFRWKPLAHNMTSEWDFLYNKAHNEFLNYLTTTGIIGLLTYLIFISASLWTLAKPLLRAKSLKHRTPRFPLFLIAALLSGYVSILITNFFGFSVVIVQLFLFLFPAIALLTYESLLPAAYTPSFRSMKLGISTDVGRLIQGIIVTATTLLVVYLFVIWHADRVFAHGYRSIRAGKPMQAVESLRQAVKFNPGEPLYRDELAVALSTLTQFALENNEATAAQTLATESIEMSDRALSTSPNNVNFWKSRTKIFYVFSQYDPQYNTLAISALEQALALSPLDAKIAYNLAILYGREGNNDKAIDILKYSIEAKPDYRDSYLGLHIFYAELGDEENSRAILQTYLDTINPQDQDFLDRLGQDTKPTFNQELTPQGDAE